ncbi:hypothetical protein BJ878DRAFT_571086 [Calycina marina]|uniref:Uncharacterized protein n=1 Tax=Calycina marina TaxID=1763456 RepID=A0A9P7YV74_9HELO|nr:hypothetical protein BJ878DRAFT_571086 [Calycina marina]
MMSRYKSKMAYMVEKLDEGTVWGQVSEESFKKTAELTMREVLKELGHRSSDDDRRYAAELKLWENYWGNDVLFPGKKPSVADMKPTSASQPNQQIAKVGKHERDVAGQTNANLYFAGPLHAKRDISSHVDMHYQRVSSNHEPPQTGSQHGYQQVFKNPEYPAQPLYYDEHHAPPPPPDVPPPSATRRLPEGADAVTTRRWVENMFLKLPHFRSYTPMWGFNPETGEPWLSISSVHINTYHKLIGQSRQHDIVANLLNQVHEKTGCKLRIEYLFVDRQNAIMLWIEFTHLHAGNAPEAWQALGEVRAFLQEFVADPNPPRADDAYLDFMGRSPDERQALSLPPGFPSGPDKMAATTHTKSDPIVRLDSQSQNYSMEQAQHYTPQRSTVYQNGTHQYAPPAQYLQQGPPSYGLPPHHQQMQKYAQHDEYLPPGQVRPPAQYTSPGPSNFSAPYGSSPGAFDLSPVGSGGPVTAAPYSGTHTRARKPNKDVLGPQYESGGRITKSYHHNKRYTHGPPSAFQNQVANHMYPGQFYQTAQGMGGPHDGQGQGDNYQPSFSQQGQDPYAPSYYVGHGMPAQPGQISGRHSMDLGEPFMSAQYNGGHNMGIPVSGDAFAPAMSSYPAHICGHNGATAQYNLFTQMPEDPPCSSGQGSGSYGGIQGLAGGTMQNVNHFKSFDSDDGDCVEQDPALQTSSGTGVPVSGRQDQASKFQAQRNGAVSNVDGGIKMEKIEEKPTIQESTPTNGRVLRKRERWIGLK